MKKFKTVRRKKRKNPIEGFNEIDTYINLLVSAFDTTDLLDLSNALIYYKQGYTCTDCDKNFYACECEYCENCLQNKCVCRYDNLSKKDLRQEIINIAKTTLNNKFYKILIDNLLRNQEIKWYVKEKNLKL